MKNIFTPADILLPKEGTDMTKWAAVACDQFSAQPEYWEGMDAFVGGEPQFDDITMLAFRYMGGEHRDGAYP